MYSSDIFESGMMQNNQKFKCSKCAVHHFHNHESDMEEDDDEIMEQQNGTNDPLHIIREFGYIQLNHSKWITIKHVAFNQSDN